MVVEGVQDKIRENTGVATYRPSGTGSGVQYVNLDEARDSAKNSRIGT
jgi:hypothetical protein